MLVGSSASKRTWALWDNICGRECCYNLCHSNAFKEFWATCDTVRNNVCVFNALDFPVVLHGWFTVVKTEGKRYRCSRISKRPAEFRSKALCVKILFEMTVLCC